jgi:hypothetical protein
VNVKHINGEIILDLTVRNKPKSVLVSKEQELLILDTSYKIDIIKSLPKTSARVNNHSVNVYYLSCSCKSFRSSIKLFPKRDIRRICKHLFLAISSGYIEKYDDLTKLMIESKFWYSHEDILKIKIGKEILYLAFSYEKEIVNLIIKRNDWNLFTFDITNKVWKKSISDLFIKSDEKLIKDFILRFYNSKKNGLITHI